MTTAPATEPAENQTMIRLQRIWRSVSVPLVAVILGLIIGAFLLIASGSNPIAAYSALLKGAFGSPVAIQRTLEKATPLIFSGLAVAFAFKAGLFNIGAQGQLLIGAVVAPMSASHLRDCRPSSMRHWPCSLVAWPARSMAIFPAC